MTRQKDWPICCRLLLLGREWMRFSWRPTFYLLTAAHNRGYCRADDKSHNGAGTLRPRRSPPRHRALPNYHNSISPADAPRLLLFVFNFHLFKSIDLHVRGHHTCLAEIDLPARSNARNPRGRSIVGAAQHPLCIVCDPRRGWHCDTFISTQFLSPLCLEN